MRGDEMDRTIDMDVKDCVREGWIEKSLPPGTSPTPVSDFVFQLIANGASTWGDHLVRLVKTPDGKIFRVGPGMGG
jgi:hypothetical protein